MNACFFDVFHDARNVDVFTVAKCVDVNFGRASEVAVQENRAVPRNNHSFGDVAFELRLIAHDFHRTATQNVGRTDHQREADVSSDCKRLFVGRRDAVHRLFQAQTVHEVLEPFAVFCEVDCVRRGAEDRDTCFFQRVREFQRGLAAELNDNAVEGAVVLFHAKDFHHVFKGQRFEIQTVRGVVVGRHGLGVAVDHDGLVTLIGQRETCVTAAVVKLDTLTDTVRAAAEDDDLLTVGRTAFAFHVAHRWGFVGGIHVGCLRFELCSAGVDAFEHSRNAEVLTCAAHLCFVAAS